MRGRADLIGTSTPDIPCFDSFTELLWHKTSLVRNRAITILATNACWDRDGKFDELLDEFPSHVTIETVKEADHQY